MAKVRMDAADGSYYKSIIEKYAKDGRVTVRQLSEDMFEFEWDGADYNTIMDQEEANR